MAEEIPLETAVNQAFAVIKEAFGESLALEGLEAGRFLNLEDLKTEYKIEANQDVIYKEFIQLSNSIRKMRSSYLPIDFFNDFTGNFDASIAENIAESESYENAFMRMLGVPIVGDNSADDSNITSSLEINIMNKDTGELIKVPYTTVQDEILNERQKTKNERLIRINDAIFNLTDEVSAEEEEYLNNLEAFSTDIKDLQGNPALPPEADRSSDPRVTNIENDIFKFSYLLVPPIQDGRISSCINEPSKIVAPPFSNPRARNINNSKIRPTLLESIIRIRLDRLSGTDTFVTQNVEQISTPNVIDNPISETESEPNADSYGLLEALFILRLRSALGGLAQKLFENIDDVIASIEKVRLTPAPPADDPNPQSLHAAASKQYLNLEECKDDNGKVDFTCQKKVQLNNQKLIEDSILILLGDNSEALDLQSQTQRNSSIQDAHLMSGIIDVIDIPRKRIEKDLSDIEEARAAASGDEIDPGAASVDIILGTDTGVGTLDIAVFALALFTMSETGLLGLLTKEQFETLKNGSFGDLLPGTTDKQDTLLSINELTERVVDGYKIFASELGNGSSTYTLLSGNPNPDPDTQSTA
jgi:hypothetical protein